MVVSNARAGGRDVSGAAHGTPLWREDREFARQHRPARGDQPFAAREGHEGGADQGKAAQRASTSGRSRIVRP